MKKLFVVLCCMAGMLAYSCSGDDPVNPADPGGEQAAGPRETALTQPANPSDKTDEADTGVDAALSPNSQSVAYENAVQIVFSDGAAAVTNPFEGAGVTVTRTGAHVVVRSTITDKELNYILSGVTSDGSVKFYGDYRFGIVLNGAGIANPTGAAINNQCGKRITVTVVDNTNNRLVDGAAYTQVEGEDQKGTFFSEGQINFYGKGSLEVRGKYKHAICADDYIRFYDGNINVKQAAGDAIHANDYIRVDAGTLRLRSAGEGLDAEKGYVLIGGGQIDIATTGEKSHGVKSLTYITIDTAGDVLVRTSGNASKGFNATADFTLAKGNVSITTTGNAFYDTSDKDITSSAGVKCDGNFAMTGGTLLITSKGSGGKGVSAGGTLTVGGGTLSVITSGGQFKYGSDDTAAKAVKCDGNLTVDGGTILIRTTGVEAEGLESKATLTVNGGHIEIEAYDDCINAATHIALNGGTVWCNSATNDGIDSNGTLTVTGGLIVSAGAKSPEEGFDCDQNRFTITGGTMVGIGGATSTPTAGACTQRSLVFSPSVASVGLVRIETSAGKEVLTFKMPRTYTDRMTMLFSSPSLTAGSYAIYTAGSVSGGESFHGYCTGSAYTRSGSATAFSASSMVTSVGTQSGPGGR